MSNWLQLADQAQAAAAQSFGLRGVADWLKRRIALADHENEDEQLRLESDADRVQVLTLHASKGLEYPLVFLPFATLRPGQRNHFPRLLRYHDAAGKPLRYLVSDPAGAESSAAKTASAKAADEALAERLRVLYVGLTRAHCAGFVAAGTFGAGRTIPALQHLLLAGEAHEAVSLDRRLHDLAVQSAGSIAVIAAPLPGAAHLQSPIATVLGAARTLPRRIRSDWQLQSFSRLRASSSDATPRSGGDDERGAESQTPPPDVSILPRGARFGVAFHDIMEHVDFAAWRDGHDHAPPAERTLIERVLQRHGLLPEHAREAVCLATARLVGATLTAQLPGAVRLAQLAPQARRSELSFHFAIAGVDTRSWIGAMHEYGYLRGRSQFAPDAQRIAGLINGIVDLVFIHDRRWWVVDYKTNRLGTRPQDYTPLRLAEAVSEGEYDLQYLIYLTALHRWLKLRLGASYDYARDVGGAVYLFVRGLDPGGVNGIHHDCPPAALIETLDTLLAANGEAAA